MNAIIRLKIEEITVASEIQSRVSLNEDTIAEYADAYRAGEAIPPVKVFDDGEKLWLADGFHRIEAAKLAGLTEIDADKQLGAKRQAVLHSVAANSRHGLRRTNADKRRSVEMILADPYWSDWSDNEVAKRCAVSNHLVADVKASILENSKIEGRPYLGEFQDRPPETRTAQRSGSTYQMDTSAIGKRSAPEQPAAPTAPATPAVKPEPVTVNVTSRPAPAQPITAVTIEQPAVDHDEVAELRDRITEMAKLLDEEMVSNATLTKVVESSDVAGTAMAEAKQVRALNVVLESRITGLMNETAEAVKSAKYWRRRAEKAEAALAKLATATEEDAR